MSALTPAQVFRKYVTDGVPESGAHKPDKAEIVQLLNAIIGGTAAIGDFRGPWENTPTEYIKRDIVEDGGSLWWALRDNEGITPTEGDDWTLLLPGVTVADGAITEVKLAAALANILARVGASRAAIGAFSTSRWPHALLRTVDDQGDFVWDSGDLSAKLIAATITTTGVASSVMTKTAHGLITGEAVFPTTTVNGLTANQIYYAIRVTADTFKLATTFANARSGSNVSLSGTTNFTVKKHRDPLQAMYVIPSGSAIDGSQGAYKRLWNSRDLDVFWFGAAFDWTSTGGDAAATDDVAAIQAALFFAGQAFAGGGDVGGGNGCRVLMPALRTGMIGSRLIVPKGVRLCGQGPYSTVIKVKDTFPASSHVTELGDSDAHVAAFGATVEDFQIFTSVESGDAGTAAIYSNCTQHTGGAYRMKVFAGARIGLFFEIGYGGASTVVIDDVETFNKFPISNNPGMRWDYSGALTMIGRRLVVQGPSVGYSGSNSIGLEILGGLAVVEGFHTEGLAHAISVDIDSSNNGMALLRGVTGGFGMTSCVLVPSTAGTGILNASGLMPNGATYAVKNEDSGSHTTGNQNGTITY